MLRLLCACAMAMLMCSAALAEEEERRRLNLRCDRHDSLETLQVKDHWYGGRMRAICTSEDPDIKADCVPVNLPIINLGMPKSGTTSLHHMLGCVGFSTAHWTCRHETARGSVCGCLFHVCHEANKPLLACSPNYDSYIQMDVAEDDFCHFPQITGVDNLMTNYPDATFVITTRSPERWAHSVYYWRKLVRRMSHCELPDPFNIDMESVSEENYRETLAAFYENHIEFVKKKAREHNVKLLILNIEDQKSIDAAIEKFGGHRECWSHANANPFAATDPTP